MVTSGVIYHALRWLSMPVDIRNICVLLAPGFSGLTAISTYLFTSEMSTSPSAGLLAAAFMGIAPGYISRSVAGSYDNEAIAITLLVFTFYLWIKSLKNGSVMWGALTALFYGYMVSAWGGYVFITNLLPLHAFVLICMGRYSPRLYVSYTTWYALGTLASMQIPFVGFLPIRSSEHMAALGMLTTRNAKQKSTNNFQVSLDYFKSLDLLSSSATNCQAVSSSYCSELSSSSSSLWLSADSFFSPFLVSSLHGLVVSTLSGILVMPRFTFQSSHPSPNINLPLGLRFSST
jgi:hypothetical protein